MGQRKGYKQSTEHVGNRVAAMRKTVANWTDEQRADFARKVSEGKGDVDVTGKANPNWRGGFSIKCGMCPKPAWVKPSRAESAHHFCSRECSNAYLRTIKGPKTSKWTGGKIERKCKLCPKVFLLKPAEARRSAGLFCSKACAGKAKRTRVKVQCPMCPKIFTAAQHRVLTIKVGRLCCSIPCARLLRIKKRSSEEIITRKLSRRFSSSLSGALREVKAGRHWESLVGYTVFELKVHIERQFKPGMTWANWGVWKRGGELKWHIDHMRPQCSFRFTSTDDPQFLECWGLPNLQPLWGPENLEKNARWDDPALAIADEVPF